MTKTEIAWLAGLFDGEGSVWCLYPKRVNVVSEIKMCHKVTIEKVNQLFPGRVSNGHLSGLSIKPQWRWRLDTLGSKKFLNLVLPYLVTKKAKAEVALRMCDRTGKENLNKLAAMLKKCS